MKPEVKLQYQFATHSITGTDRNFNTDICEKFDLLEGIGFVVCDGIDGINGEGGALAAKLALEGVKRHFRKNPVKNPMKALQGALMLANFMVYDHAMKNERFTQIGVSIIVVLVVDGLIYYASVGTNQFMLQREGVLYQLVKESDENSSTINVLGREKNARLSLCKNPVQAVSGDVLLVSSNGLNVGFSDQQIAELLAQDDISVDLLCFQIIYKLEEAKVSDNATLGICRLFDANALPVDEEVGEKEITKSLQKSIQKSISVPKLNKRLIIVVGSVFAIALFVMLYGTIFNSNDLSSADPLFSKPNKTEKEVKNPDPVALQPSPKEEKKKISEAPVEPESTIFEYRVQKGDTFFQLSLRFNVPVKQLETLNNMNGSQLRFGQRLKIPVRAIHTVKPGESFSLIGQKYQVSVSDLMHVNSIKDETQLKVGASIIIPLSAK
ncbi:MAG: LysM peptidoglycan-binding domain-containing protein [Salinivirgaceae bacterium]|nr:LysM peptidoglycan-binding domain-containing protein [Salinivirgaceae bacterium]MDD4747288.1 LysM peptidoglycan-binding domain-containing protein [Salinivirgaceae bacterium]MDY0280186.1 LysM peptidoglycan-binding domain-containing protein [Salinivirgaceae bacterium]